MRCFGGDAKQNTARQCLKGNETYRDCQDSKRHNGVKNKTMDVSGFLPIIYAKRV
jgi:hypothetical protein